MYLNNKHRKPLPNDKFNKKRYNVRVLKIILLNNKKFVQEFELNKDEVLLYSLTQSQLDKENYTKVVIEKTTRDFKTFDADKKEVIK